jgi:antitoxin VapB
MPLFVKDPEVDRLARRLSDARRISKTEVVRQALRREMEREDAKPDLVALGLDFARRLRARGDPARAASADKAFIDALYEAD